MPYSIFSVCQLAAAFRAVHLAATLTTCLAGLCACVCVCVCFASLRVVRFVRVFIGSCGGCCCCCCHVSRLATKTSWSLRSWYAHTHTHTLKYTHTQTLRERLPIQSTVNIKYVCGNILWRLKFKCSLCVNGRASKSSQQNSQKRARNTLLLPAFICHLGSGQREGSEGAVRGGKAAAAVSFC